MRREWFREYLMAGGEESLSCGGATEAYRLMWLGSFRNSKIFTIRRVDGFWRLQTTSFHDQVFDVVSPREPHKVARSTRVINEAAVRRIAQELELSNFWSAEQYRHNPNVEDGYALVIEGRSGNKYRALTRVNNWDGAEQIACPFFDLARVMLPDPIRCARPVTVD